MKILVLGARGQVGRELSRSLLPLGNVMALGRQDVDFVDGHALRRLIREQAPDLVVNAAAYTAVDLAESAESAAMAVNAHAPGILAEAARDAQALLIHYSTDYVFDGKSERPYTETDSIAPQSVYGRSKALGEQAIVQSGCDHVILRTSWVFGGHGHNFLRTVLRLAREREQLRIVADQIGAPTWSRWIADATAHIAREAMHRRRVGQFDSNLYHLTSAGSTSWHGFASEIIALFRAGNPESPLAVREILPITTADYPTPAKRPSNSRLSCAKLAVDYGIAAPDWRHALELCLEDGVVL